MDDTRTATRGELVAVKEAELWKDCADYLLALIDGMFGNERMRNEAHGKYGATMGAITVERVIRPALSQAEEVEKPWAGA